MTSQLDQSIDNNENIPTPRKNDALRKRGLIAVIYVNTTTVRFIIYATPNFQEVYTAKEEIQLLMPRDGWFEQDPMEIMTAIYQCCSEAYDVLPKKGYRPDEVLCMAITNQRETTIMWHAKTGKPLYSAIVWNDIRTVDLVDSINKKLNTEKQELLHKLSGLRVSPYFSALKIRWMLDNVPAVREAHRNNECKAGTLDSWILWNLTNGEMHMTDVTNASRTLLMNISNLNWDPVLLQIFQINAAILPKIRSSSEIFGTIKATRSAFKNVIICGIIGNQQAALVGQSCLQKGQANCYYGHGGFLLYNTGPQLVYSTRCLLTTIAYKMGPNAMPSYALEGSVAVAGRVFEWMSTKMRILPNTDDAEIFAQSVNSAAGCYFVPAFTGLYAPYWRKDARGIIVGLTTKHTAKHIVRAAHDAICYQIRDIIECLRYDCGISVFKLHANGKFSENKTLMQLQADIAGIPLAVSLRDDRTALGAAFCAAHAYDFDLSGIAGNQSRLGVTQFKDFFPTISRELSEIEYQHWLRAVKRSMGWKKVKCEKNMYTVFWLIIALFIAIASIGLYYLLLHFEENQGSVRLNMNVKVQTPVKRRRCRRGRCPFVL